MFLIIVNQIVKMLLLLLLGIFCYRKKLIDQTGSKMLANLLLMIVNPMLAVLSLQVERQVDKVDFSGKQLYVAFATQPRLDRKLIHFPLTDDFIGSAVPRMEKRHLRVVSKKFPEETHGTVALPGFYDGLKTLFFRSAVGISLPNEPL